jgi:hypothetical protein
MMTALQWMILQPADDEAGSSLLFAAWPCEWDVDFKLAAPMATTVEGVLKGGKLMTLTVTPAAHRSLIHNQLNCSSSLKTDDDASYVDEQPSTKLVCALSLDDCTSIVQAALDKGSTVVLPARLGGWPVGPLFITRSHTHLVLEENCTVFARNGSFHGTDDMLLRAIGVTNLTIEGTGSQCGFKMDKSLYMAEPHLYPKSEDRMGLAIYNCSDVKLRNFTVRETGGDGLYINNLTRGSIVGVKSVSNYRQAMSIISASHLHVDSCSFADTAGTEPAAGIDCEPNHPRDVLHNISFNNCAVWGNVGGGVVLSLHGLNSETPLPVGIIFTNCQLLGDAGGAAFRMYWEPPTPGSSPPAGFVTFAQGSIRNAVDAAVNIYGQAALNFTMTDTIITNSARSAAKITEGYEPLQTVAVCGDDSRSSVTMHNISVLDSQPRPFFLVGNQSCSVAATFNVHNPTGCRAELGTSAMARDVSVDVSCNTKTQNIKTDDTASNHRLSPPSPRGRELRVDNLTDVWGRNWTDLCGLKNGKLIAGVRGPELVKTPNRLLLFGQCRRADDQNPPHSGGLLGAELGDNMLHDRIVMKSSTDTVGEAGVKPPSSRRKPEAWASASTMVVLRRSCYNTTPSRR